MKKAVLCLLAAITLTAASVWAEPDNGRVLPSFHLMGIENVFFEGTGGVSFPLTFFTQNSIPMTSFGGEFSFSAGYNWDGWLIGAEAGRDMWGQGVGAAALMNNFNNNLLLFRLQRVLSKNTLHFLPEWLEFVPGLGIGVNFITTDYYPSQRAKNEGRESHVTLFQEHADTMFYRLSLEASFYLGTDYFIPFVGGDYSAFYDTSIGGGFAGFATAFVGIRTYPLGVVNDVKRMNEKNKERREEQKKAEHDAVIASWGEAVCAITADPDTDFTPDGDGYGGRKHSFLYVFYKLYAPHGIPFRFSAFRCYKDEVL